MQTRQTYCTDFSLQAGEPLFATATATRVYLLLEHNGAWGEKALEESDLPDVVKAHLKSFSKSSPETKALLIKQRREASESGINFFVGIADERDPTLYAFHLDRYEDLLGLNLNAILAGASEYLEYRRDEPMFLVCTNGRRDPCCARNGVPVLNALSQAAGASVWESSHVGGHRFAANLTCLPHGLLYGRVNAENAGAILESYQRGEIYLPNLRGRMCYPPVVQAADYYLRQESGLVLLDAFHLLDAQEMSSQQWQIQFTTSLGQIHQLAIHVEKTEAKVYESCLLDKSTSITRYKLLSHQVSSVLEASL